MLSFINFSKNKTVESDINDESFKNKLEKIIRSILSEKRVHKCCAS